MQVLARFLRPFFHLLYHNFSWSYDLVANLVSFGRWKNWVRTVVPLVEGTRILELGHGPGHLQRILRDRGLLPFGLDESRQMGNLARNRLRQNGYTKICFSRGIAQELPFPAQLFDSIVATFPSEYFLDPRTLSEVNRTLIRGGRFVVLPVAWITGKNALDRFLSWLFRITGQAPSDPIEIISARLRNPFLNAGFSVEIRQVEVKSSLLLIVVAQKM